MTSTANATVFQLPLLIFNDSYQVHWYGYLILQLMVIALFIIFFLIIIVIQKVIKFSNKNLKKN